jgi:dipeptidyl aminopeptidase/acylaminoacyl peptidase
MRLLTSVLVSSAILSLSSTAKAQGSAADYLRADSLPARVRGKIVNSVNQTNWIGKTSYLWYRKTTATGTAYVIVNADSAEKRAAFDQARLAAALTGALRRPIIADSLPLNGLTFTDDRATITFSPDSVRYRCTLADYRCGVAPQNGSGQGGFGRDFGGGLYGSLPIDNAPPRVSPDSQWEASVRNFNIYVKKYGAKGEGFLLSTEGSEGNFYAARSIAWSPDSKRIAAYRIRPGYHREVHYVESSPEDQLQPKHSSRLYSKPGDVLDVEQPVLFEVASKRQLNIDNTLFPNAYDVTPLTWRKDGRAVVFEYNQRGHQAYRVIEIDPVTGKTRAVIDEQSSTFFEYSAKKFRFDFNDGRDIIWMSERDGWNHLYMYDGITGKVIRQITKGPWVVREVDKVDTLAKQIWFTASGMYPGKDPYFVHAYRINFDGTGLVAMTQGDAMHSVSYSQDMKYFVDISSRIDQPPTFELRRTSDRALVSELEKTDASALYALGWKAPEPFVAKARDGKTDIYGIIVRPMNFDPSKKYPVVENIYAGPQGSFVPKTFYAGQLGMQQIAELGFIVVQIDGMGTSNRSKAFHDVAWRDLGDAGFPDRILWHKAVAAKYPNYDISRVGIYGTSAGGQNSMGALLFHPEFYKVSVSAAGCHDNRMDKIWWNEQWMGWPIGPEYGASSNVDNAYRLQGKLLLIVGEMDRNVDPSSTFQVANALIKAKKTFDMLVIPGADHTSGGEYGDRKRWDFFVHHLLGVEPPDRNGSGVVMAGSTR